MYAITQSWKKRKTWVLQTKKSYTNWICEENAIDHISNHTHILTVEGCKDYFEKIDTFQEWHTWVGVVIVV
jgi:hypothetical protein